MENKEKNSPEKGPAQSGQNESVKKKKGFPVWIVILFIIAAAVSGLIFSGRLLSADKNVKTSPTAVESNAPELEERNDSDSSQKAREKAERNGEKLRGFFSDKNNSVLVLDKDYDISAAELTTEHSIKINGCGHMINIIPDDPDKALFEAGSADITVENTDIRGGYFISAQGGYTEKLGKMIFEKCSFSGKGAALISNPRGELLFTERTPEKGISQVKMSECTVTENENVIILTYDMPVKAVVEKCTVKELRCRIVACGVHTPDSSNNNAFSERVRQLKGPLYSEESMQKLNSGLRAGISLEITGNTVRNNTLIPAEQQYYCFVWMKGGKAVVRDNTVEGLAVYEDPGVRKKVNEPSEIFDMYLMADEVLYENNVSGNNYYFDYLPDGRYSVTEKDGKRIFKTNKIEITSIFPNIKSYTGKKTIKNSSFSLKKEWLQKMLDEYNKRIKSSEPRTLDSLEPPPLVNLLAKNEDITIENNTVDVYMTTFSRKDLKLSDKSYVFRNNNIHIEKLGNPSGNPDEKDILIKTAGGRYEISGNEIKIKESSIPLELISGVRDAAADCVISNNDVTVEKAGGGVTLAWNIKGSVKITGNHLSVPDTASSVYLADRIPGTAEIRKNKTEVDPECLAAAVIVNSSGPLILGDNTINGIPQD